MTAIVGGYFGNRNGKEATKKRQRNGKETGAVPGAQSRTGFCCRNNLRGSLTVARGTRNEDCRETGSVSVPLPDQIGSRCDGENAQIKPCL
jgi:hypothetical protein